MTHIDQIIADALAGSPETHVAILAREVVRLREAPSVAVPPLPKLTGSRADAPIWGMPEDIEDVCLQAGNPVLAAYQAGIRRGHSIAENSVSVIPADRVLGKGMVAVEREELAELLDLVIMIQADEDAFDHIETATDPILERWEKRYPIRAFGEMIAFRDALRANQGGVDHG